ncbi:amidase [Rhodococcus sp. Q]|uniref:amidase n=1 Tax=Rhodococcus sp. Q TaxID=2502252 RepID=UPI0010F432D7|nr:amidase [Rhodococcus sp. Q]
MSVDTGQQGTDRSGAAAHEGSGRARPTLTWPTLAECARSLADGDTTSVAMVTRSLDAIDAAQPTLNAFKVVRRAAALAEAADADRRLAAGERLPLLGVPIAVKDDVDVTGEPTAFGCAGDFPTKTADSEAVRRLRAAGAVIVGKTHSPELGQWPFTGGTFGHTRNPWARDRTPGGSSGGSAAAVAAGLVPAALGSDGAGSVRIPASWTNLVGIKPQRGRISTWPDPEAFNGVTVFGPLARTVEDAALLLDLVAGPHEGDLHTPRPLTVRDAVDREPGRLRIALSLKLPFTATPTALHPEIRDAVGGIAHTLRRLGHEVVVADPAYGILLGANFLPRSMAGLEEWRQRVPDPTQLDPRTLANARTGRLLGGLPLRVARAAEPRIRRRIGAIFNEFDVILAPTTATPPPRVDAIDRTGHYETDKVITAACPYAWPWNVLGWPSVGVPAGFTDDGLPRGVQLMGHESSEPLLVSLAAQLERELRWDTATPERWW